MRRFALGGILDVGSWFSFTRHVFSDRLALLGLALGISPSRLLDAFCGGGASYSICRYVSHVLFVLLRFERLQSGFVCLAFVRHV